MTRKPPSSSRSVPILLTAIVVLSTMVTGIAVESAAAAPIDISTCQTIDSSGTYRLTQDITDSGATRCIQIDANDVIFDGQGFTIDGTGTGFGIFVENTSGTATNVTVRNVDLSDWGSAVYFTGVEQSTVQNVRAWNNDDGIYLDLSSDNTIDGVTATQNGDGLSLYDSSSNTVTGSDFSNNTAYGVNQALSGTNTFTNVVANDNAKGFILSDSHQITDSTIRNNSQWGVYVGGVNNVLTGNTIAGNGAYGVLLDSNAGWLNGNSYPNSIYDNVLNNTNNTNAASSLYSFTTYSNVWNATKVAGTNVIGGSIVGGNFWATPDGTGFSETCTDGDGDGLCDSANSLGTDNVDYYPLADPSAGGSNQPPTASFAYSPSAPTTSDTIAFDATASSDSDGSIASYDWDFNDDGLFDTSGPTPSYLFETTGDHAVTLRVTDDDGATGSLTQTISVTSDLGGGGSLGAGLTVEQDQPACVAPGGKITAVVNATDLNGLRIVPRYQGYLTESDMSVTVDGQAYTLRDPITYNTPKNGPIGVTVDLTNTRVGSVALEYYDSSGNLVAVTGPSSVHNNPLSVPTDFNNIQEAVDVACPGSTIEVDDGTYSEVVTVEKDLTITSATGASPTIQEPGSGIGNHLFAVQNGATVTLSGFTVDSQGARGGVGAYQGANVTVHDVTVNGSAGSAGLSSNDAVLDATRVVVQNAGDMGAMAKNAGELTIQGATIDGTGYSGVVVKSSGVATVSDATIQNTGLSGVIVFTSGNATIEDSTITASDSNGVFSHTDGNALLSNVTISDVADDGALVTYGGTLSIHNSTIRDVPYNATRALADGSQLTVADSTISNASAYGVYSGSAAAYAFRNNISDVALAFGYRDGGGTIVDNTMQVNGHAIQADGASLHVEGNDIDAYGLGVDATGGAIVSVDHNEIHSGYQAVHVADPATAVGVIGNVLSPTTVGVGVYTGAYTSVMDNQIVSGSDGLHFNGNDVSANAINNTISNVDNGIFVAGADVTIRENDVSGTTGSGIDVRDTVVTSHVEANDVSDAGNYGIRVQNASASVVGNTVTTASYDGIFVDDSTASVDGNHVTDANDGIVTRNSNGSIDGNVIRTAYNGLSTFGGSGDLTNNTVENVTGKGIQITDRTRTITNNSVTGGDYGLWADVNVTAKLNSFTGAFKGIRLSGAAGGSTIRYNDLSNNTWAIENDATGSATPSAPLNYYGPRGPTDDRIANDVADLEPFLTRPPSEVDTDPDNLQAWGLDLEFAAGDVYAFGTPGPMAENLSTVFGDFDGAIYTYDESAQSWTLATGDEVLGPMDAVVVIPQNDTRAVVDFADATPAEPTTRNVTEGWNFVAPRSYTDADDGYSTNTTAATDLLHLYGEGADQPGSPGDSFLSYSFGSGNPPQVSPFAGQFVYVTEDGTIPGRVPKGVSVNQGEGPLDYTVPTEDPSFIWEPITWNFQLLTLPSDDPEIMIGAPGADAAFAVTGGLDGQVSLDDANATFEHGTPDVGFGESVASVGDVNGDSETDYLVGAPLANGGAGEAYLFYGPVSGAMDAANADVTFVGEGVSHAGDAVAAAGDVNGDGLADLLIGAPNYDDPASGDPAGAAYIVYGRSGVQELGGEFDLALANARMSGWTYDGNGERAGTSVASAGDLNGDGYDDVLVGAPGMWSSDNGDVTVHGGAYVVFGGYEGPDGTAPRGHWYLSDYADRYLSASIRVTSIEGLGGDAGTAVAGAGDVDGDGYDDFLVGAPAAGRSGQDTDAGAVYLVYGGFDAHTVPENVIFLGSQPGARAGESLAGVGDVDGDGYDDFLVGAPNANGTGEAYLLSGNGGPIGGATSFFGATIGELSYADATFTGASSGDAFGTTVAPAGDLDGDTRADFLIGAPGVDDGPGADVGAVYVYHGDSFAGQVDPVDSDVTIVGNVSVGFAGSSLDGRSGY